MPSFTNKTFSSFYKNILGIDQSGNTGVDTTTRSVQDGDGNNTSISLSDDQLVVQPQDDDTIGSMIVKNNGGDTVLAVDTTNKKVLAGAGQYAVNTNYAVFGVHSIDFSTVVANKHYAIPFVMGGTTASNILDFGTGTDPDDTFTTSDSASEEASRIVPMMWRLPDNITIDSVTSLEGADNATGDTTRMHLKSFRFTSGSTSCLSQGALLAHNDDVTNAGVEQAYLSTWTVDSADVDANKVILAFMRSDSINSDYSLSVTVKYHLR